MQLLKYSLGILVVALAACGAKAPSQDGVWVVGDSAQSLPRTDKTVVTAKLLSAPVLETLPHSTKIKTVQVRAESVQFVSWVLPMAVTAVSGAMPQGTGTLTVHPDDPHTQVVTFEPKLPEGLVILSVVGGPLAGNYAVVNADSHDWAMAEGLSWFALRQYDKALPAFERAADLGGSAKAYWYLGSTQIQLKQFDAALKSAKEAYSEAQDADIDIVEYAALVGEARMQSGDYHGGLEEFEKVRKQFPTDPRADRVLGRLLAAVQPSPEKLSEQVYATAARQGADGVEDLIYPPDLEQRGDAGLASFIQFLSRYGRATAFKVLEVRRFGRSATVSYNVRFSDGTYFDRSMDFFLDDAGAYKIRLPAY